MKRWSWLAAGARAGAPPLFGQARYFAQRPVAVGMRLRRGPLHVPLAGPAAPFAPFAAAAAPFSARRFQAGGGQPDHYKALGVAATASTADIKAAYKKLALQYHPDRNKAAGAEDRFKEISAAYSVLSNDSKRKEYDTMRQFGGMGGMGGGGAPGGMGGMRPGQGFGRPGAGPGAAGFPGGGFPGMGGNQRVVNISKEDAEKLFAELFGGRPGQSPFGPGGFAGGAAPMGQSTAGPFGQGGPFGGSPFSMRNQTDAGGNQFRMYQDGDGNIRSERTVQDRSGNTYKVSQQVSSDGRTTTTRREQHFSRGPGGGAQNYQEQFGFKQHHQQQAQQAQQQYQQQQAQQGGQGGQQSTPQGGGQQGQGQQQGGQQQGQNPFGFGGNRPFDNAGFTFGGQPFGFQPRRSGAGYFAFLAVVTIVIVSLLSFVLHNPLLAIFLVLIYVALRRGPVM